MQEVRSVAILGAGAMGASYASWFFNAGHCSTSLIASGERYERLTKDGLVINDRPYAFPVANPDHANSAFDLIIVALKHHHLLQAVGDIKNMVGDDTTIISVMNGLDSEEALAEVYGWDKVLYAIAVGMDAASDYPHQIGNLRRMVSSINELALTAEEKEKILGGSAKKLLGL